MHHLSALASRFVLLCAGLSAAAGLCGCQTQIAGMTLPSAHYLRDDTQFFPAGPEFLLSNERRAHEEYRAAQADYADDYVQP